MELKLDNVQMDKLSEALGRPKEDLIWEELKGMNQQAISMSMQASNYHLLMSRMEALEDIRGLVRM